APHPLQGQRPRPGRFPGQPCAADGGLGDRRAAARAVEGGRAAGGDHQPARAAIAGGADRGRIRPARLRGGRLGDDLRARANARRRGRLLEPEGQRHSRIARDGAGPGGSRRPAAGLRSRGRPAPRGQRNGKMGQGREAVGLRGGLIVRARRRAAAMLTFKQIEALYWVVQLGGFANAAERLNTTQSAITKRIQELETSFDIQIFNRSGQKATLTRTGEELLEMAADLLGRRDQMLLKTKGCKPFSGSLRPGTTEIT